MYILHRLLWAHPSWGVQFRTHKERKGTSTSCHTQSKVMLYLVVLLGASNGPPCPYAPANSLVSQPTGWPVLTEGNTGEMGWSQRRIQVKQLITSCSLTIHIYTFIKPLFESSTSFQPLSLLLQKHEDNCKTAKQQYHRYLLIPSLTFT